MLSRTDERVLRESVIQKRARELLQKDGKINHYDGRKSDLFDFSDTLVKGQCNFKKELFPYSFLAPVRTSQADYIEKLKYICPDLQLIYSMWNGYLEDKPEQMNQNIRHIVYDIFGGKKTYLHTYRMYY